MRPQSILTFIFAFTTFALGVPLVKRSTDPSSLGNLVDRATNALDVLGLSADDFNTLTNNILDHPTQKQADFVTTMVYEIFGTQPPTTFDGTISDDVKAAFAKLPSGQQRTIIEIAMGSGTADDGMTSQVPASGSAAADSPAAEDSGTDGNTTYTDPSAVADEETNAAAFFAPAGAAKGGKLVSDTNNSTALKDPSGAIPAVGVVIGSGTTTTTTTHTRTHNHTHTHTPTTTAPTSILTLNPEVTVTTIVTENSNTTISAAGPTTTTPATIIPTTTSKMTPSTSSQPTTTPSTPTSSSKPASYWYTKPKDAVGVYLRCIDKAQADALIKSMKSKASITNAEINDTIGRIAVYQVGDKWAKPAWCATATDSTSTTATASSGTVSSVAATITAGSSTTSGTVAGVTGNATANSTQTDVPMRRSLLWRK
ncbi:hypothetical protein FRB93_000951 [Tulasnella sp. JGI-2019a]|nr:hypothetical protein FRB93_000951 [Tulasnella sp. JGI-2019a]